MKSTFKKSFEDDRSENYDLLERLQILAENRLNERNSAINDEGLYSADATPESKQMQFDRNDEKNNSIDSYFNEFD